jgi:hypothetical protein
MTSLVKSACFSCHPYDSGNCKVYEVLKALLLEVGLTSTKGWTLIQTEVVADSHFYLFRAFLVV